MAQDAARPCPYVGPRAFVTGEPLYGRDREVQDLLDLVIAERIVVVHSPSGAGKSSLLQAGLIPRLRAEGFTVGSTIRVGFEPPEPTAANRYVLSALISLEESAPAADHLPVAELARQTLAGYLERRRRDAEVLIFDQFEEVLTLDPADHDHKLAFFAQLAAVLKQRGIWAVFAIREDHLAALDPYRRLLPTRLTTTYRLDLLGTDAAIAAIQAPARAHGVEFTDPAARKLVDDLSIIKVARPGGGVDMMPGRHVEAVQLQVVCRRLWDRLPVADRYIDLGDVTALGDVDQALADYCDAAIAAGSARSGVAERLLRTWMQRNLVTDAGLRTQVLLGSRQTRELDERALASLTDAHLLRAEQRRGMHWIELAHDRLVAPLARSNQQWLADHLSPLQRQAELWDSQGRPEQLLLADPPPAAAELTAVERAFLEQSRIRRDRIRRLWLQRGAILLLLIIILAGLVVVFAILGRYNHDARLAAETTARLASESAATAMRAADVALSRQLAAQSALQPVARADIAALLAVAASEIAGEPEGRAHLFDLWARFPLLRDVVVTDGSMLPWSARGRFVATVDEFDQLHFWDRERGVRLGPARPALAYAAAISPTRPLAVSSESGDTDLILWDLDRDRVAPIRELEHAAGFEGRIDAIVFSPDGARFAVINSGGSVAVWDASGDTPPRYYPRDERTVSFAFHPDGRHLAFGGLYGAVELTSLDNKLVDSFQLRLATIAGLRFDTTGTRLLAFDLVGAHIELALAADKFTPHNLINFGSEARFVAYTPDLQGVLLRYCTHNCERAEVALWDLASKRLRVVLDLGDAVGTRALLLDDTGQLLTGHPDGTLRIWDPARRPLLSAHARGVTALTISADGRRLISGGCVSQGDDTPTCSGELQLWDRQTQRPDGPPLRGHASSVRAVQLFDQDRQLVSVDETNQVLVWTLADRTSTPAPALPTSDLPPALAVIDSAVIAAVADDTRIRRIDVLSGRTLADHPARSVRALALARDGRLAAAVCTKSGPESACNATEILLWPASTGEPQRLAADSVARHPADGQHLAPDAVTRLAFAPDGQRLAAATATGDVRLWTLSNNTVTDLRPDAARLPVADLRISDDGEQLATISCADATCQAGASVLHLWSTSTGRPASTPLLGHSRFVPDVPADQRDRRALLFTPDGHTLVSGSLDGALVWDQDPATLRAKACTLAGRSFTPDEWTRFLGADRPYEPTCP